MGGDWDHGTEVLVLRVVCFSAARRIQGVLRFGTSAPCGRFKVSKEAWRVKAGYPALCPTVRDSWAVENA